MNDPISDDTYRAIAEGEAYIASGQPLVTLDDVEAMGDKKRCGCRHLVSDHEPNGPCTQWWRYPDVLDARKCGCTGVWERKLAHGEADWKPAR